MLPIPDDRVIIVGRTQAGRLLSSPTKRQGIDAVISIGDATERPPAGLRNVSRRLRLMFDDELTAAAGGPTTKDVSRIIEFGKSVDLQNSRLLIHCQAGISRSAAAAVIVLTATFGTEMVPEIQEFLHRAYPACSPNLLMLQLADDLLSTGGILQCTWANAPVIAG